MFKDVLNHANLTIYAEIGLVIFTVVFVAVIVRTLMAKRADVKRWSEIPLDDGQPTREQR
jgi:hypothetical protein